MITVNQNILNIDNNRISKIDSDKELFFIKELSSTKFEFVYNPEISILSPYCLTNNLDYTFNKALIPLHKNLTFKIIRILMKYNTDFIEIILPDFYYVKISDLPDNIIVIETDNRLNYDYHINYFENDEDIYLNSNIGVDYNITNFDNIKFENFQTGIDSDTTSFIKLKNGDDYIYKNSKITDILTIDKNSYKNILKSEIKSYYLNLKFIDNNYIYEQMVAGINLTPLKENIDKCYDIFHEIIESNKYLFFTDSIFIEKSILLLSDLNKNFKETYFDLIYQKIFNYAVLMDNEFINKNKVDLYCFVLLLFSNYVIIDFQKENKKYFQFKEILDFRHDFQILINKNLDLKFFYNESDEEKVIENGFSIDNNLFVLFPDRYFLKDNFIVLPEGKFYSIENYELLDGLSDYVVSGREKYFLFIKENSILPRLSDKIDFKLPSVIFYIYSPDNHKDLFYETNSDDGTKINHEISTVHTKNKINIFYHSDNAANLERKFIFHYVIKDKANLEIVLADSKKIAFEKNDKNYIEIEVINRFNKISVEFIFESSKY